MHYAHKHGCTKARQKQFAVSQGPLQSQQGVRVAPSGHIVGVISGPPSLPGGISCFSNYKGWKANGLHSALHRCLLLAPVLVQIQKRILAGAVVGPREGNRTKTTLASSVFPVCCFSS